MNGLSEGDIEEKVRMGLVGGKEGFKERSGV
jgi:hypothetical protein